MTKTYKLVSIVAVAVLVLGLLLVASPGKGEGTPPRLSAWLSADKPLCLEMQLLTGAVEPTTIDNYRLPWGNVQSMVLVATTRDGEYLRRLYPIDDPSSAKVSITPNAQIRGEVCLEPIFPDVGEQVKRSEILVFWAYEAPKELGIPQWSGGWVLIPKDH